VTTKPDKPSHKKTLLLVYPDLLGDFLLFVPHLIALKPLLEQQYASITWVCQPAIQPLVQYVAGWLPANLTIVPITHFERTGLSLKKWLAWPLYQYKVRATIAAMGLAPAYDELWCPSLAPWVVNGVVASIKNPRKLGRGVESPSLELLQNWVYTEQYRPKDFARFITYQHHVFFQQALGLTYELPALTVGQWNGLKTASLNPVGGPNAVTESWVLKNPFIVIVSDSANAIKEWPLAHFVDFIEGFCRQFPSYTVVITGVQATYGKQLMQQLSPACVAQVLNLMGKTTLLHAMALMAQAEQVLCSDSFALHATTLLGKHVVCLTTGQFGGRYWPYPHVLDAQVVGHLGTQRFVLTPHGNADMASLTVDTVLTAFVADLQHRCPPALISASA
jgi:ADP-heptose:LPS heptosyltransferase